MRTSERANKPTIERMKRERAEQSSNQCEKRENRAVREQEEMNSLMFFLLFLFRIRAFFVHYEMGAFSLPLSRCLSFSVSLRLLLDFFSLHLPLCCYANERKIKEFKEVE